MAEDVRSETLGRAALHRHSLRTESPGQFQLLSLIQARGQDWSSDWRLQPLLSFLCAKVGTRQDRWDHVASSHNVPQTLLICEWHEFQEKTLDLALLWFELMRGTCGTSFSIWKMKACALENVLAFPLPMFSRRSCGKVSRLHLSVPLKAPESSRSLIIRYLKTSAPGIFSFLPPR